VGSMTGFRILLADDDPSRRELWSLVLAGAFPGAEVRAPTDGLDLGEVLHAGNFDVAVVSAPLAWAPVDRVLIRIRAVGRSSVLVAEPGEAVLADALRIGADAFLLRDEHAPLKLHGAIAGLVGESVATRSRPGAHAPGYTAPRDVSARTSRPGARASTITGPRPSLPGARAPLAEPPPDSLTVDLGNLADFSIGTGLLDPTTDQAPTGTRPAARVPADPQPRYAEPEPAADLRSYSATVQVEAHRPGRPPPNPLDDLLVAAHIGYFRCDPGGKLLRVSPAACNLLGGLSPSEALRTRSRLGLGTEDWVSLLERLRREGRLDEARVTLPLPGGGSRVVALTMRYLGVPPDAPLEGVITDRNEEDRLWQRLQDVRLEAAGESVGEATGVIDLQERRLRRAGERNDDPDLLAELSHDLAEPLRSMRIYADLLTEEHGDELDSSALELVTRSRAAADRMGRMLQEVLSKASGDFTPEPEADSGAVLEDLLDVLQPRIEEAGATITHDPLPVVAISSVQLDRLFQNLVVNAILYRGDEPPRIHVSARDQGDRWVFAVADNGRGIPHGMQERIFQRFERGRDGEGQGMGLGLAVCKRIVEAHGGTLTVHSEGEGGSTFEFSLPKHKASGTG